MDGEIPVERAEGRPSALGHVTNLDRLVFTVGQELDGGFDDALTPLALVLGQAFNSRWRLGLLHF